MQITFVQQNQSIGHSDLISSVFRTDLVPVPISLELAVLSNEDLEKSLVLGAELVVGEIPTILSVIKVQPIHTGFIKDGRRIGGIAAIAIPKDCLDLIRPSSKAVILKDTSFNSAIRACGARIKMGGDIPLPEFICLKGSLPTERIATYFQQEASVMRFKDNQISAVKLDDLFKQDAVLKLDTSMVLWEKNPERELHEKSAYMSVDADGSTVLGGDIQKNQHIVQKAGLDTRQLRNLNKVLVRRGVSLRPISMSFMAGDVFEVESKKYVVVTAAHSIKTGAIGGAPSMVSKFWIASL